MSAGCILWAGYSHFFKEVLMKKRAISNLAALVCFVSAFFTLIITGTLSPLDSSAVSQDYPAVLLRISAHDNSRHMNISGYDDKAAVVLSEQKNTQNENWRFDYVGTDKNGSFYKITNMGTGRQITPMGYKVSERHRMRYLRQ